MATASSVSDTVRGAKARLFQDTSDIRSPGKSIDALSSSAEVSVLQEQLKEASDIAHAAALQVAQLKKRLDEFLFEESDSSRNTVDGVSMLLTTTSSLSSRLSVFEGTLTEKFEMDLKSQEERLLDVFQKGVSALSTDVRRILVNFREEIMELKGTTDTHEERLNSLRKDHNEESQKWELESSKLKLRLQSGFTSLLSGRLSSVTRRNVFTSWQQFVADRKLIQRQKRALEFVLGHTSKGIQRTRYLHWKEWAIKKATQRRKKLVQEFAGRLRYGVQYSGFRKWKEWVAIHQSWKKSVMVQQESMRRFLSSTVYGARQLAWKKWKVFAHEQAKKKTSQQALMTFLKQTSLGLRQLAYRKLKNYAIEKKKERQKKELADAVRGITSKGLQVVFFRKWKSWCREKIHRTSLLRQGEAMRSMTSSGLRQVYFHKWRRFLAERVKTAGRSSPQLGDSPRRHLHEATEEINKLSSEVGQVQDVVADLQGCREEADNQLFLLKADLQVLQLDMRCLQKDMASSIKGVCEDQYHLREEWKLDLVESRVQQELREDEMRDSFQQDSVVRDRHILDEVKKQREEELREIQIKKDEQQQKRGDRRRSASTMIPEREDLPPGYGGPSRPTGVVSPSRRTGRTYSGHERDFETSNSLPPNGASRSTMVDIHDTTTKLSLEDLLISERSRNLHGGEHVEDSAAGVRSPPPPPLPTGESVLHQHRSTLLSAASNGGPSSSSARDDRDFMYCLRDWVRMVEKRLVRLEEGVLHT